MALEAGFRSETVTEGKRRFMAASRKEETVSSLVFVSPHGHYRRGVFMLFLIALY